MPEKLLICTTASALPTGMVMSPTLAETDLAVLDGEIPPLRPRPCPIPSLPKSQLGREKRKMSTRGTGRGEAGWRILTAKFLQEKNNVKFAVLGALAPYIK